MTSHPNFDRAQAILGATRRGDYAPAFDNFADDIVMENGPGAGPYDVLNTIVSQDAASVVSDSWGQCESEEGRADAAAENVLLEEAAVQGQTVVQLGLDADQQAVANLDDR